MNPVMRKLKSKRGASMLLAMMFMAFCVFVGGSVLSAAVANGSRVAKQSENQQAYLSQRSAALVIADELKGHPDDQLQMTVVKKEVSVNGKESSVKCTFSLYPVEQSVAGGTQRVPKTKWQQILYDNAANHYLSNTNTSLDTSTPYFENEEYSYDNKNTSLKDALLLVQIVDPLGKTLDVTYQMTADYDLTIDLGQLHLSLNANVGTSEPVVVETSKEELIVEGSGENMTTSTKVTTTKTTTTTTIIRWDDPVIRKGGASNE